MAKLEVGQKFRNFDDFLAVAHAYGAATHAVFSTIDSRRNGSNQYIKLGCKHFGKPRSRSKGIRSLIKTFKQGCPVYVYAKQKQSLDGCDRHVFIAQLDLNHQNHDCTEEIVAQYPERRRLDEKEKEMVASLISSYQVQGSVLQAEVRRLTGKLINTQDIANLRYEIREQSRKNFSKLEEAIGVLLEVLQKDSDATVILGTKNSKCLDEPLKLINLRNLIEGDGRKSDQQVPENLLMIVFIQLGSMQRTFLQYPEILLMDDRYNVTECAMPVNLCMVMDEYGRGRVISYTFLANKLSNTIAAVLECHKLVSPDAVGKITRVVIDKDYSERGPLVNVIGKNVIVELCISYTQKVFEEHTEVIVDKCVRDATREVFKEMLYSESEVKYFKCLKKLKEVGPVGFYEYFLTHWDSIREAWVQFEKLFVPIVGNNATNDSENKSKLLKALLDGKCSLADTLRGILLSHENKESSVSYRSYEAIVTQACVVPSDDPDVTSIFANCPTFPARLMLHQMCLMRKAHKLRTDGVKCKCPFFKSMSLPCCHIFFHRHKRGVPKFHIDDVPERWQDRKKPTVIFKQEPPDVEDVEHVSDGSATLVDINTRFPDEGPISWQEKYRQGFEIAKSICLILAQREPEQFRTGLQTLTELQDRLMAGENVVMAAVNMDLDAEDEWNQSPAAKVPKVTSSAPSVASSALDIPEVKSDSKKLTAT